MEISPYPGIGFDLEFNSLKFHILNYIYLLAQWNARIKITHGLLPTGFNSGLVLFPVVVYHDIVRVPLYITVLVNTRLQVRNRGRFIV